MSYTEKELQSIGNLILSSLGVDEDETVESAEESLGHESLRCLAKIDSAKNLINHAVARAIHDSYEAGYNDAKQWVLRRVLDIFKPEPTGGE